VDKVRQSEADAATHSRAEAETIPPTIAAPEAGGMEAMPERFGRYRIIRELGRGGMGSVYLAEDTELDRQVALKIPKVAQQDNPELVERFYREARAAATLNHTNICQVHDIGEHEGTRYITMAYISGPPLSKLVGSPQLRSERTIAKLVRRIAVGLAAAHGKGILHRDLKPGNILLDERNEPVITDFGLARRVEPKAEERLTQDGTLIGTPAYMSSEQVGGDSERIGPASDVYSLGVILYELLTAELPYKGPITAVIGQIIQGKPKRPSELRSGVDKRLEAICLKMMAGSVDKRYSSAAEVSAALSHFLEQTSRDSQVIAPQAAGAHAKLEEHKQRTIGLLKQGKFDEAAEYLQKLSGGEGAEAEPYAAWAVAELARLKAMPKEVREKGPELVPEAIKLLAQQDYRRVIELLEGVPEEYRSSEAGHLLNQAQDLASEADQLNERMKQAVRDGQYDGLRETVLERLLELEPGNLTARDIFEHLGTYGPGEELRFDKTGVLLPAHAKYWWLDRLAQLVYQRVTRRPVRRGKARARREGEPEPAADTGSDMPLVPIAIGLGVLGVVAVLLAIVYLLRDGAETAKVKPTTAPATMAQAPPEKSDATKATSVTAARQAPVLAIAPFDEAQAKQHQQEWAEHLGVPVEMTNSIGMKFVLIPPGEFDMGSTQEEVDRLMKEAEERGGARRSIRRIPFESPQHRVRLTRAFCLCAYEVTQQQYRSVLETNPSGFSPVGEKKDIVADLDTSRHPVEMVSWYEAIAFCNKLSELEGFPPYYRRAGDTVTVLDGNGYRLPTEAEWEYACRAGTTTWYSYGNDEASFGEHAWHKQNSDLRTHPAGEKKPNAWGLYDMHGNVREWCADWFGDDYYAVSPMEDPPGSATGSDRVLRGGTWTGAPRGCRAAFRSGHSPDFPSVSHGCRVARSPPMRGAPSKASEPTAKAAEEPDAAPVAGSALAFDGQTSYVLVDSLQFDGKPPWTVEAIVTPSQIPATGWGATVTANAERSGILLAIHEKHWSFGVHVGRRGDSETLQGYAVARSDQPAAANRRVHLAGVWDGQRVRLFVDGRLQRQVARTPGEATVNSLPFMVGANPSSKNQPTQFFSGSIEAVHFSKAARNATDFAPPQERLDANEHALVTYHFDEGQGDVLHDASGHGHHGKIVDAKWVHVEPTAQEGSSDSLAAAPAEKRGKTPPSAIAPFDAGQAKKHQQAWAEHLGVPVETTNSIGMKLMLIPPGEFDMGTSQEGIERGSKSANEVLAELVRTEGPQHRVRITRPFCLGVYEVTQAEYERVTGTNPSFFSENGKDADKVSGLDTSRFPVENVSSEDAMEFCQWLSRLREEERAGRTYRLPTEAEWEYACRAGTTTVFHCGDRLNGAHANFSSGLGRTTAVGSFEPNAWGLYDMHGNVFERCADWHDADYYASSARDDPQGPSDGTFHVLRGGSWVNNASFCRSAIRIGYTPPNRRNLLGLRVALALEDASSR